MPKGAVQTGFKMCHPLQIVTMVRDCGKISLIGIKMFRNCKHVLHRTLVVPLKESLTSSLCPSLAFHSSSEKPFTRHEGHEVHGVSPASHLILNNEDEAP